MRIGKAPAVLHYDTTGVGSNDVLTMILYGIMIVGFVIVVSMMFWN